jgi:hypothetical protein
MGLFKKKKTEDVSACEFSEVMEGAMNIQGKALVNQTELSVAYQAYTMFRWHDGFGHDESLNQAAIVVIGLEKEIEKLKTE